MLSYFKTIYYSYSKEVWYLTMIVMLFVSRKTIFNVQREVGQFAKTVDSGTSLAMVGIILSIIAIYSNRHDFALARKTTISFVAYYLLCMSSFMWAGQAGTIIFKASEVLCCFYVVSLIITKMESLKQGLFYIIILATSITYIEVLNGFLRYGYLFHHTNTYSLSSMAGLLLCLGAIRQNLYEFKELKYYIILNVLALIGGTSSASWISCIIGLFFVYSSNKNGLAWTRTIVVSIIFYIIYQYAYDEIFNIIFKGKTKEMVESGHGRQVIWDAAIASWKDSPWLGNGFLIGERTLWKYGLTLRVISVHNSILSALVGTGSIGLILFLNFTVRWFAKLVSNLGKNIYSVVVLPPAIAILINCMGFPAIGSDWNFVAPVVYALISYTFILIGQDIFEQENDVDVEPE